MRVSILPTTQTVTVTLTLGGTVQLALPELWLLKNGHDETLGGGQVDESTAVWSDIPAPQAGGFLDMTVYWNAFEPMHDHWVYAAIITVTDQNGVKLPGYGGEPNPRHVPSAIGEQQPSFGRGSHVVFVQA